MRPAAAAVALAFNLWHRVLEREKGEETKERERERGVSDSTGTGVAADARAGPTVDAAVLGGGETRGTNAAREALAVVARAVLGAHDVVAGDDGAAARGARRARGADARDAAVVARRAVEAPLVQDVAHAERRVACGTDEARGVEVHGADEERLVRDRLAAARAHLERVRHAVARGAPQAVLGAVVLDERQLAHAAHKARVVVVRAVRHRAVGIVNRLLARGAHGRRWQRGCGCGCGCGWHRDFDAAGVRWRRERDCAVHGCHRPCEGGQRLFGSSLVLRLRLRCFLLWRFLNNSGLRFRLRCFLLWLLLNNSRFGHRLGHRLGLRLGCLFLWCLLNNSGLRLRLRNCNRCFLLYWFRHKRLLRFRNNLLWLFLVRFTALRLLRSRSRNRELLWRRAWLDHSGLGCPDWLSAFFVPAHGKG